MTKYFQLALIASCALLISFVNCVNEADFRKCSQSHFCVRNRASSAEISPFKIVYEELNKPQIINKNTLVADISNSKNDKLLDFKLQVIRGGSIRIQIDEKNPITKRYRVVDALQSEPILDNIAISKEYLNKIEIQSGILDIDVIYEPFEIRVYSAKHLTVKINGNGLMRFEHRQQRPVSPPNDGSWDETFNGILDTKPNGPEAVGLDFSFPTSKVMFGIPQHGDRFALKTTLGNGRDPYRLYNADVPGHILDSEMGLYGSIPVIYAHGPDRTAGVFWHNAAETWVDIISESKNSNQPEIAHFISESGIIDAIIMIGGSPNVVFERYTELTGVGPLPQLYQLGYHQCRWSYDNESDVKNVANLFNYYKIPMDTIWLDIGYTDGKRYFTWDPVHFSDPKGMLQNITSIDKYLNLIIDIHIKADPNYRVHKELTEKKLYTKYPNGTDYVAECWPGTSSYPDTLNPAALDYLAEQYSFEKFPHTTDDVQIWNDMNEPSAWDGPDRSFPKDLVHYDGKDTWEHRDIHNLYGHMQLKSTFMGLKKRSKDRRPFVLTRAHFAGSQRYAAVWTGDNTASWEFLRASIYMCLTESVVGYSFCGADVGGFFGNVKDELFERWYQAGAFQPFFRSHASEGTDRREPWLFASDTMDVIRAAIKTRYTYLPFWYTLFYEHELDGRPIMRPMLAQYPKDEDTYLLDTQYMLADKLLVCPVTHEKATHISVYFPKVNNITGDIWYDIDEYKRYNQSGQYVFLTHRYRIPVFQRGGTIIPKKHTVRMSTKLMKNDPLTIIVCLNNEQEATGSIYIDDEQSLNYKNNQFLYKSIKFYNKTLSTFDRNSKATYNTDVKIEKVIIAGLNELPKSVSLWDVNDKETKLTKFKHQNDVLFIEDLEIKIIDKWEIRLSNPGNRVTYSIVMLSIGFLTFILF